MSRTEIIEGLIDKSWKSKKQFAESVGIPPTTLQSILKRGIGNASIDNVIKVCKGLGITVEQLETMATESQVPSETGNVSKIPVIKESGCDYEYFQTPVAAGVPASIEGTTPEEIQVPDEIMGKYAGNKNIFFLQVNGQSMNKLIPHESMIAVKKIELTELANDDIVVYSNSHEYSVKRFYNDVENKQLRFRAESTDNSFTDDIVSYDNADELLIHGKVIIYIVKP